MNKIMDKVANSRASGLGVNSLSLAIDTDGYTLAHEIGHAKFSLKHPDDDTTHLADDKLRIPKSLKIPINYIDKYNFMYSKSSEPINDKEREERVNGIRAYQWRKIIFGKY
jgi:hypothetical protein